jgi:predicted DNA-binding protein YlxM (UPF0122 family)
MKRCVSCDKTYDDSLSFCINCGKSLELEAKEQPQAKDVTVPLKKKINSLEKEMGKNSAKVGKLASLPFEELVTLVDDVSCLREDMEALSESISAMTPVRVSGSRKAVFISRLEDMQHDMERMDTRITNLSKRLDGKKSMIPGSQEDVGDIIESKVMEAGQKLEMKQDALLRQLEERINKKAVSLKAEAGGTDMETLKKSLVAEQEERLQKLDTFKERILVITGLILEQQEKIKLLEGRIRSSLSEMGKKNNEILTSVQERTESEMKEHGEKIEALSEKLEESLRKINLSLAKRSEFEGRTQAEMQKLAADVWREITNYKDNFNTAIKNELKSLEEMRVEYENKLQLSRNTMDSMIRKAIRTEMESIEKTREQLQERTESMVALETRVRETLASAVKRMESEASRQRRENSAFIGAVDAKLQEFEGIREDSREKLAMVKNLITNMEKRFGAQMEALQQKTNKIIKLQEKNELDRLSPEPGRKLK